jgi:hypothetical protein
MLVLFIVDRPEQPPNGEVVSRSEMSDHFLRISESGSLLVLIAPEADREGEVHSGIVCVSRLDDLQSEGSSRRPLPSEVKREGTHQMHNLISSYPSPESFQE